MPSNDDASGFALHDDYRLIIIIRLYPCQSSEYSYLLYSKSAYDRKETF